MYIHVRVLNKYYTGYDKSNIPPFKMVDIKTFEYIEYKNTKN